MVCLTNNGVLDSMKYRVCFFIQEKDQPAEGSEYTAPISGGIFSLNTLK